MPNAQITNLNTAWLGVLRLLTEAGAPVAPRGQATREWPQVTLTTRLDDPVLTIGLRKLNHRFMAAEARWIINGSDRVAEIALYNSRIARYSDDGERFYGAYGPRYRDQLPYVVQRLAADPDTRQAGLTLWIPKPGLDGQVPKDVPCTIALFFQIRFGELNVHAFMRSSDAWLGLPYDVFNFSMLGYHVMGFINQRRAGDARARNENLYDAVRPGTLYLTMASSHLYEEHLEPAQTILTMHDDPTAPYLANRRAPEALGLSEEALLAALTNVADGHPRAGRWWELSS